MTLYRVCYHCSDCPHNHCLDKVIQMSDDAALDGQPLIEAYNGNASAPEILAILGEIRRCPLSQKIVAPELDQFFLEVAR